MSSSAQICANRANSLHSTGPLTEAGKQVSSRNALQHGLRATPETLFAHDPQLQADFNAHRENLLSLFNGPLHPAELALFEPWAFASFQAQRAQKYEVLAESDMLASFGDDDLERRWMRFTQMRLRLSRQAEAAMRSFFQFQQALQATLNPPPPDVEVEEIEEVDELLPRLPSFEEAKRILEEHKDTPLTSEDFLRLAHERTSQK